MYRKTMFRLANPEDDEKIRQLCMSNPMQGGISFSYDFTPSFFSALMAQGYDPSVVVAEKGDRIIAMGTALRRLVHVGDKQMEIGYLGGLRLDPLSRNSTILSRGYRFLGEIHRNIIKVPFYISSILESNCIAMKILTSGRTGLPHYREIGRYLTFAIPIIGSKSRRLKNSTAKIIKGDSLPFNDILDFLNYEGRKKLFSPVLSEKDFSIYGSCPGKLSPGDFLLASDGNSILGAIALWNQDSFRRIILEGYGGTFKVIKNLSRLAAKAGLTDFMPEPGTPIRIRFAACLAIKDDNPNIFSLLLNSAMNEMSESSTGFLVLGLSEKDPLAKSIGTRFKITIPSRIYAVSWDDISSADFSSNNGVFHLEAGTL